MLHEHVRIEKRTSTSRQCLAFVSHALVLRLHQISPRPGIEAAFLNPSKDARPCGAAVARGRLTLLPLAFPTVMAAKEVLRDPTAAMTTSFVARTCPPPTPIPRNRRSTRRLLVDQAADPKGDHVEARMDKTRRGRGRDERTNPVVYLPSSAPKGRTGWKSNGGARHRAWRRV